MVPRRYPTSFGGEGLVLLGNQDLASYPTSENEWCAPSMMANRERKSVRCSACRVQRSNGISNNDESKAIWLPKPFQAEQRKKETPCVPSCCPNWKRTGMPR